MTKIIQRHDTAANWTSVNPVLAAGEMGVETDTNKFKFGDGVTAWSGLEYATSGSGGGSGTTLTSTDGTTTYSELVLGDNFVVNKHVFTMPKLSSDGTLGGDTYACIASSVERDYYAYKAFDNDTSTQWGPSSPNVPQYLTFYSPDKLIVSNVYLNFGSTSEKYGTGSIQGSNDNSTWDTIGSFKDNTNAVLNVACTSSSSYKYIRAYFTGGNSGGYGKVVDMNITATIDATDTIDVDLENKQDKLTAVAPIKIYNDDIKNINVTPVNGAIINEDNTFIGGTGYLTYNHQWDLNAATSWEYKFKLKFGGWNGSQNQAIFFPSQEYKHPVFNFTSSKQVIMYVSTNGSSWTNVVNSAQVQSKFVTDNLYYFKCGFTGSNYYIQYNSSGWDSEFTQLANVNSTAKVSSWTGDITLCGPVQPCTSTLYLEEYTLTVNGENVFTALTVEPNALAIGLNKATTSSLGVVQPDGTSITVSETGVISGQDVKTFTGYSDTGTLVLKSINGVLQWVAE